MARHAVVTGGAGFIGSHLCEALVAAGWRVTAVDNLVTGSRANLAGLAGRDDFGLIVADACDPYAVEGDVDAVLHLASMASPPDYLDHPIDTLRAGSVATEVALETARASGARFLLASTSEVYGDPLEHPQSESYHGNVNPVGPRSVYDEAKRYAEAITMAYQRSFGLDAKIARIFNTMGPRLRPADGRVVSNFLNQALDGVPLTVYGDGHQTRSFCYVDDLVRGIVALLGSDHVGPVNIGNPDEFTVLELAEMVLEITGSSSSLAFSALPDDDPVRRRPDITLARKVLDWEPTVPLREGLGMTLDWYRQGRLGRTPGSAA